MKKLYALLFIAFAFIANAQIVNIPDANFKARLLQASPSNQIASTESSVWVLGSFPLNYHSIDTNNDGEIQVNEAQAVRWLDISNSNIFDLTGIETFVNLEQLYCSDNQMLSMNLSFNTSLAVIDSSNNQIQNISLTGLSNLVEIDFSSNVLNSISFENNSNYLSYINLNNNQLTSLDLSNINFGNDVYSLVICCSNNLLTNFSLIPEIRILYLNNNDLNSIIIPNNSLLERLECSNNSLTVIDLANCPYLSYLDISFNNLTSLDISNNYHYNNGINSIDWNWTLLCNNNNLTNLIFGDGDYFNNQKSIKTINCSYNQLTDLKLKYLDNVDSLNCSFNNIYVLTNSTDDYSNGFYDLNYFPNYQYIKNINANNNFQLGIIKLRDTNTENIDFNNCNSIYYFYMNGSKLTSLDVSNLNNLYYLYVSNNLLTNLVLNNTIVEVFCSGNNLTNLNVNFLSLEKLRCDANQLTNLNINNCINLVDLYCQNNLLTNLNVDALINLKRLYYSGNAIDFSSLNQSVINNLFELGCSNTGISNLNVSSILNLIQLYCLGNQLTNLDVSQNLNLVSLYCSNNLISNLDVSENEQLQILKCENNQLLSLNIKNNMQLLWNNFYLEFDNNPNLQYICADEEDVAMVQSKINAYGYASTCHVNSYCSFTPGGTFYTIEGNNRFDGNANGCDVNDFGYPYLKFNVTDDAAIGNFIANETGEYFYDVHAGTHTMTPVLENPSYFNISPTTATINFPAQASPFTQDFCITPNGVHHDLEVTIIPLGVARPGFDASYKIVYKNKGNQLANPVLTFAFDDVVMDFLNATVVPNSQSTGLLSWSLGTLAPLHSGNFVVNFNLNAPTETPALNGGDILNYTATINPIATDETPTDNVFALNQTVVNSYDPNDKTCLEGETINPSMIGEYVHYQIRFENTGTYPAQNVAVKDMIDATKFDIATLQMVITSHSCYTRITGNKVEFIFENINLPFDDATNDGYVVFKIKTLPTLTINSTISNTAEIYFDYNFPIVTNTATSTYQVLANQDFDFANEFTLYPNPVKNVLNINAKNGLEIQSLEIYNTFGQLVIAKPNFEQTIDVSVLPSGTYFIKASTEKGSGSMKFVKQ